MRRVLRWLFMLFLLLAGLVGVLTTLFLIVLARPELVVNEATLNRLAQFVNRHPGFGIQLSWRTLKVVVENQAFLRKRLTLRFEDLCVRNVPDAEEFAARGCFSEAELSATGEFAGFRPRLLDFGPTRLLGGEVEASEGSAPSSPRKMPGQKEEGPGLPAWLRGVRLLPMELALERWQWRRPDDTVFAGDLRLSGRVDGKAGARVLLKATGRGAALGRGTLTLRMSNPRGFHEARDWVVVAQGDFQGVDGTKVRADARILPELRERGEFLVQARGKGTYSKGKERVGLEISGRATPTEIAARLSASARELLPGVERASARNCEVRLSRASKEAKEGRVSLNCPLRLAVPVPPDEFTLLGIPTEVGVQVSADLASSTFLPDGDSRLSGRFELGLLPILTPLFEGLGKVSGTVDGLLGKFPDRWFVDSDLILDLRIPEFARLVDRLSNTPWAVPAPLHVLRGNASFRAAGRLDLIKAELPLAARTRLNSRTERFDVDSQGQLDLLRGAQGLLAEMGLGVSLSDLRIELPRLGLAAPPRILPDPRIRKLEDPLAPDRPTGAQAAGRAAREEALPSAERGFHYEINLKTPPENPVLLVSNLAKTPVPVYLDLKLSDRAAPSGVVRVDPFPLELFRRNATVERFELKMAPIVEESEINGLAKVSYTDYRVEILLLGTVGKPQLRLRSDPPLPEDQLVAVLLFGQPLEQLDPEQSASIGSTRAAFAEGALGLASLYLLASTPVQSVAYDPESGLISAKVRLGEGTSLNLGADPSALQTVGIRKRLGPRWAITTELFNPTDSNERQVSAYLEWNYRY